MDKPIQVTQASLPHLKEFVASLEQIWDRKWLTNNGHFHQEFEKKLVQYLGVKYISVFSNGTLALMTSLQVLGIKGEVITTPYSFVATSNAMIWNDITPVFCDIDPVYGNLDIEKIESLITKRTTAIVPVHVYGNPIDVEKLEKIAKKHNLKVIYDAAHAFGVQKNKQSILNFGDLSVLSFHATKSFSTIEGGAIISHDYKTKQQIDYLKNFGFVDEVTVIAPGINGKMNELQAAFGLLQLKSFEYQTLKRKEITEFYRSLLKEIKGIRYLFDMKNIKHNYSYFPIFIENNFPLNRDQLYKKLKENGIFGRRYFYPLISDFPMYNKLPSAKHEKLLNSVVISNEVICLPIYPELEIEQIRFIIGILKNVKS